MLSMCLNRVNGNDYKEVVGILAPLKDEVGMAQNWKRDVKRFQRILDGILVI